MAKNHRLGNTRRLRDLLCRRALKTLPRKQLNRGTKYLHATLVAAHPYAVFAIEKILYQPISLTQVSKHLLLRLDRFAFGKDVVNQKCVCFKKIFTVWPRERISPAAVKKMFYDRSYALSLAGNNEKTAGTGSGLVNHCNTDGYAHTDVLGWDRF